MSEENHHRLIESCLREVLSGEPPPDLTQRILDAMENEGDRLRCARRATTSSHPVSVQSSNKQPHVARNGSTRSRNGIKYKNNVPRPSADRRGTNDNWQKPAAWIVSGIAIAVLGIATITGFLRPNNSIWNSIVKTADPEAERSIIPPRFGSPSKSNDDSQHEIASSTTDTEELLLIEGDASSVPPWEVADSTVAHDAQPNQYRDPASFHQDEQIVASINAQLRQAWSSANVQPAPLASDEHWCRRTYLRLVGRVPTDAELRRFVGSSSAKKKSRLVRRLTSSDGYVEEFASHWADVWTKILAGSVKPDNPKAMASHNGLHQYIASAFRDGQPFDELVHELISAVGTNDPGSKDFNGATNYLASCLSGKAELATSRTARAFLGMRLDCARCHDRPDTSIAQSHYWGFNSFFRQAHVTPLEDKNFVRLADRDFGGEGTGRSFDDAEVYYELPNGELQIAYPEFIDGTKLSPSGRVDKYRRREELAKLITASPLFRRSFVDRVWSQLCEFGLTPPIDNFAVRADAYHPELLAYLSKQFASRDHRMSELVRWIALSDAFTRSSEETSLVDDPINGTIPLFSRYYTRPTPSENAYDFIVWMVESTGRGPRGSLGSSTHSDILGQVQARTDTGEEGTPKSRQGTDAQNDEWTARLLSRRAAVVQPDGLVKQLIESDMNYARQVDHLFLACLFRHPSPREKEAANQLLAVYSGDVTSAIQDLWWALKNSSEFALGHGSVGITSESQATK